jgi:hypothetical protein
VSTGVLPYDLNVMLSSGEHAALAVIERDMGAPDSFGGNNSPDWQTLATVPCMLWWDKSSGVRSANREYVTPARMVPVSQGGILVASGTDVTEDDRIANLLTTDRDIWITGLFTITAVIEQTTHREVYLTRSHLGA